MISARKLDNGISIVMEEMPHLNSVSCGVWVRTGSCDEDPRVGGISHFVEHMMFKGTPDRDAYRISCDIDRLGASMNAFTGKEATCFYIKAMSENYLQACDVICDMLEHALFDTVEMDRERHVIEEEIKMSKDDPEDFGHDELGDGLFSGTPLGKSVIGTATNIRRVNHNVMADYVSRQYTRDSIVVSIAGRFDPDEVCSYFGKRFMTRGASKPARPVSRPEYLPFARSFTRDINQAHIFLGTKSISMDDEKTYAYQIMNNIMGGSMSSRLFQNIREKKGLAYTVYSDIISYAGGGYFEIYAGVSMDNVRKTLLGIKDELERLADTTVTDEELESSRAQMKSIYVYSQESTSARMIANGKNYLLIGKYFRPEEVMDGFNSVTAADIDDIKQTICDMNNYAAVVVSGKRTAIKEIMSSI
ncbi:MAG: insulinase family protein [Eubacterium sp.]|nr:insulinase family protein [Eubacterium sp.]